MKSLRLIKDGFLLFIILILALSLIGCTAKDTDASTSYILGFLFCGGLLILVPIMLLVWFLIRKSKEQSPGQNKDDKYLAIAKERYAKGEITQEQYEQIKKEFS